MNQKSLGRALKSARQFIEMSREDAAEAAGLTESQLARLEQGVTAAPSFLDMYRLAEVLGVTLDDLSDWAQEPEEES